MSQLVSELTQTLGRTVQDRTGLTSRYDFTLQWTPAEQSGVSTEAVVDTGASIFTALQEQLGLKLEAAKAPVQCLVIDNIDRPSAN